MNKLIIILSLFPILATGSPDYKTGFASRSQAGDFYLKTGDTLREDVSVSGNARIDGVIDGDLAVMGGSVTINGKIDGDVLVFGGEIENYGVITGDAAFAGGSIKNRGRIAGDIAVAGGSVELDSGSVVEGDIATVGGSVNRSDYAIVEGEITALDIGKLNRIMPRIGPLFKWRKNHTPLRGILSRFATFAFILVMYILSLLVLLIFPDAIETIGNKIKHNIWIDIAIGIGIEVMFVPLIILFVISIIGIPIIPAFILAISIAIIFGISAFSSVLGERVCLGFNWPIKNKIGILTIGWLAMVIILILGIFLKRLGFFGALIWILGVVILYVAATIGLGSVGYALIKKDK